MKPEDVRTAEDVRQIVEERNAEHATIGLTDMQGLLRGKYVSRDKLLSVLDHDWGMPPLVLALDFDDVIMEAPVIADGSDGFADGTARLLPATCREIPWESPRRNLFFLAEYSGDTEPICPRAIYRRIEQKAHDMGYLPYHALEYEFTLFEETAVSAFEKGYRDLKLATPFKTYEVLQRQAVWTDFYDDLLDTFGHMNVPLETAHEEMGAGLHGGQLVASGRRGGGGQRQHLQDLRQGHRAAARYADHVHGALVQRRRWPERACAHVAQGPGRPAPCSTTRTRRAI